MSGSSDFFRILSFLMLTVAQILLAVFLLAYGSETSKLFAIFLLILEGFVLVRFYHRVLSVRRVMPV